MGYFNYHAKVKNLIKNGEFEKFEIVDSYHGILPCMVIYFKHFPPMPIREHKFFEYLELFDEYNLNTNLSNKCLKK